MHRSSGFGDPKRENSRPVKGNAPVLLRCPAQDDRELPVAGFGWIVECFRRSVALGRFEVKAAALNAVGQSGKASLAVCVGADLEIKFMRAEKSVGDVNLDFGGIHGLAVNVIHGEIGSARSDSSIDHRNRLGIRLLGRRLRDDWNRKCSSKQKDGERKLS